MAAPDSDPVDLEMQLRRADTTLGDDQELANVTYNDKYVVVYDFSNVGAWMDPAGLQLSADGC